MGEGNDFESYGLTFLFNLIFISGEFTSVISLKNNKIRSELSEGIANKIKSMPRAPRVN